MSCLEGMVEGSERIEEGERKRVNSLLVDVLL